MLRRILAVVAVVSVTHGVAASAQDEAVKPADFAHQIAPILRKHCAACHAGKEAKGGFSINTRSSFLDDGHVVAGKSARSRVMELIRSTDVDEQMPPRDRPRLTAKETALLAKWIDDGIRWEPGFSFAKSTYQPPLLPRRVELPPVIDGRAHPVDRIVDHYLVRRDIERPMRISDARFCRRVHLDLVGLLPDPDVLREFLDDTDSRKRERLIRRLLDDDLHYTEHWLTFWNDLLRNDYGGTGFITGGRKQVSKWLYDSLAENKPFDQMARELIAPPSDDSRGFIDGIKWRGTVSAGQTLEIQFAQSVSQSFLGINMKCASCHDSFIDRWKLREAYGLAAIYAEQPLKLHRCDKPTGEVAKASWLFPELGQVDPNAPQPERLQQLAALMTHPNNGRFTRTIVNRLWGQLMGRGLVHPLDAMQTKPWSEDLLDFLAVDFQEHGYDLKRTLELIATSEAYQSEVEAVEQPAEPYQYRGPRARRVTAEQFVDAVWQLTGAAPYRFDAPVIRGGKVDTTDSTIARVSAQWIWGASAQAGAPPAGETLAFFKKFRVAGDVKAAAGVITCDNEFRLLVNGKLIAASTEWTQLQTVSLTNALRAGDNELLVVAKNAGNAPNAAGLFAEFRIQSADGKSLTIATNSGWQYVQPLPAGQPARWRLDKLRAKPAAVVPTLGAWKNTIDAQATRQMATALSAGNMMVRASLLKADFLMRSLGRPNRDQIVTSRPSELTTLEAIDLSNNQQLAKWFSAGGVAYANRQWSDREALVAHVYHAALSRSPSPLEMKIVLSSIGEKPQAVEIEDVLWAICVTPEFLLIR